MKDRKIELIEKLHIGKKATHWGAEEDEYSIKDRLHDWESHHSCMDESELYYLLEEMEDKINELIEKVNSLEADEKGR
jgi:hypothetical protein